jgi:hypothetical protein
MMARAAENTPHVQAVSAGVAESQTAWQVTAGDEVADSRPEPAGERIADSSVIFYLSVALHRLLRRARIIKQAQEPSIHSA